jgi:hypothetical protein
MPKLEIATACWVLAFVAFCLYRCRFLNHRVMDQPAQFETVHRVLLWLHLAGLSALYLLAAKANESVLLLQVLCSASAGHIFSDWFSYRRALLAGARLQEESNLMPRETAIRAARCVRFGHTREFKEGRRKRAWLAFLAVLVVGPFGYLYYNWRVTVGIFLGIGPWSALSTQSIGEIVGEPSVRYPVLFAMAFLAWADVRRRNIKVPDEAGF